MESHALERGDKARPFNQQDTTQGNHTLEDHSDERLVLVFLPEIYEEDTHTLLKDLRERKYAFEDHGAHLLGVAVAPRGAVSRLAERLDLNFDILADAGHYMAEDYGVWAKVRPETDENPWGVSGTTFVIGSGEQRIEAVYRHIDPDTHTEELLADLRKLAKGKKRSKEAV